MSLHSPSELPIAEAPTDGTRILVRHYKYHYHGRHGWKKAPEPVWTEVRWVNDRPRTGSQPHWEEWTGNPRVSSSNHIKPEDCLCWCPVD